MHRAIPAPMTEKYLRQYWKEACAAVGVTEVRLHDLRHCYGQWLTDAGVKEAAVRQSLRHKDAAMTRRYTASKDKGENAIEIAKIVFKQPSVPRSATRSKKRAARGGPTTDV